MITLNKTIIKLAETITYPQNKNTKQNKKELQDKLTQLKNYFAYRFPFFTPITESHITQTYIEFSSLFANYKKFTQQTGIQKLQDQIKALTGDDELLHHFYLKTFTFGRNKAHHMLNLISKKATNKFIIENEYKRLLLLQTELIHRQPQSENQIKEISTELFHSALNSEESRIEKLYRPTFAFFDETAFVNLTEMEIPYDIKLVLSFGPKFVFAPADTLENTIHFLDDFSQHLDLSFPIETQMEAYKQLSIEMTTEKRMNKLDRGIWLDFLRYRIMTFKHNHPDLCIARSDKGKHTVLIPKNEYIHKMDELVLSTTDYMEIPDPDITTLQEINNDFVKKLSKLGTVPGLRMDNCTTISQMYGLIKIHKKDYPVRPITAACSAPGFKLAKSITKILDNIFPEDGFHIKNSTQFVQKLTQIKLEPYETMISFDVVSMFTNIPIDHMIILIRKRAAAIYTKYKIPFALFKEILLFLLKDCAIFAWNNKVYKQRDSLAMGSPLSPILAKILMTDVIKKTLPYIPIKPNLIGLYMDDSFWIIKSYYVNLVLRHLNQYHTRLNFTVEKEIDGHINFLDVSIFRDTDGHSLYTNWYKKPYASSRLLNYFSYHEKACIIETAKAYIRMIQNLSDGRFFHTNKILLEDILRRNSFPEMEILVLIRENYSYMKKPIKNEPFTGKYVPIKYKGNFTQRLKNKIHPFLFNARLVGTPDRIDTKHYSYLKGKIDVSEKTNVVLLFKCQCKKNMIIRHTQFNKTAEEVITLLPHARDSMCVSENHSFPNLKVIRCKNYTSMIRTFNMFAYAYRDILLDTEYESPHSYIAKCLNLVRPLPIKIN